MQYVTVPEINGTLFNAISMPNGVIAVTSGLQELLSEDELKAVLLHEEAHRQTRDAQILVAFSVISSVIWFVILKKKGFKKATIFNYLWMIPRTFLNWNAEFRADAYVVKHGYGEHLITALQYIEEANHTNVGWKKIASCITHPPTNYRAKHMRSLTQEEMKS